MIELKRALVADDHEITRRGIQEILRDAFPAVEIDEVGDFPAAVARATGGGYDLVLLDALMPGSNLVDAIRKLRAADAAVRILVVTAVQEVEYVFESLQAGANGLIHKHRASDELLFAVRKVMEGGTYMHPETAVEVASAVRTDAQGLPHRRLSERELEIFRLIAKGRSIKEIAADLGLSDKTVATYLARIREKTGLHTYVEIARYAINHRIE